MASVVPAGPPPMTRTSTGREDGSGATGAGHQQAHVMITAILRRDNANRTLRRTLLPAQGAPGARRRTGNRNESALAPLERDGVGHGAHFTAGATRQSPPRRAQRSVDQGNRSARLARAIERTKGR